VVIVTRVKTSCNCDSCQDVVTSQPASGNRDSIRDKPAHEWQSGLNS
jgi:hypothetical protein